MTPQISTDPSQSKRLLDCGVNPDTADFVWMDDNPPRLTLRTEIIEDSNPYILAPSWSLSALLALLPTCIEDDRVEVGEDPIRCFLIIFPSENGEAWTVRYANGQNEVSEVLVGRKGRTLVEAAVRMIETLANKRIKLNKQ